MLTHYLSKNFCLFLMGKENTLLRNEYSVN